MFSTQTCVYKMDVPVRETKRKIMQKCWGWGAWVSINPLWGGGLAVHFYPPHAPKNRGLSLHLAFYKMDISVAFYAILSFCNGHCKFYLNFCIVFYIVISKLLNC